MTTALASTALGLLLLFSPHEAEQITAAIDPLLLQNAERLDIVFVSDKFSYLSYLSGNNSDSFKAPFPVYTLSETPQPVGACLQGDGSLLRKGAERCGFSIALDPLGNSTNLLAFSEIAVKGSFRGTWRLCFADDSAASVGESVTIASFTGDGSHLFKLDPVFRGADLSRSRTLFFLLDSPSGSAAVESVSFRHARSTPLAAPSTAVWAWNRGSIVGNEQKIVEKLSAQGIRRVYLQISDDLDVFTPFLKSAAAQKISVYALDGSPDHAVSPQPLLDRIGAVEAYNRTHPEAPFAGFQTDIEPYLKKDFQSRKAFYAASYLRLLQHIKKNYAVPLSVVVPFWFDTIHLEGKSLIEKIVQTADEIVVMSYRTGGEAVLDISRSALSLGEQYTKPVWLGVELSGVPDEHHVELRRCDAATPDALRIAASSWCRSADYVVPGSRISFKGHLSQLPSHLKTEIPFTSFRGWVLHNLEEVP